MHRSTTILGLICITSATWDKISRSISLAYVMHIYFRKEGGTGSQHRRAKGWSSGCGRGHSSPLGCQGDGKVETSDHKWSHQLAYHWGQCVWDLL